MRFGFGIAAILDLTRSSGPGAVGEAAGCGAEDAVWVVALAEVEQPGGVGSVGELDALGFVGREEVGVAAGQGSVGELAGEGVCPTRWVPAPSLGWGSQAARISTSRWSRRSANAVAVAGTRVAAPWKWWIAIAERGEVALLAAASRGAAVSFGEAERASVCALR